MTALLRREGWRVNEKRILRIWREEGLRVPKKRPRKRRLGNGENGIVKSAATGINDVWAWDFFHDRLEDGRQVKWLSLIDEYTRECLALRPAKGINAQAAVEIPGEVVAKRGAPRYLRSDNGPEFIAKAMRQRLEELKIGTKYIEPGSPWQNGFAESFHGRVREEFIGLELFRTYFEAKVMGEDWRQRWNHRRLHGSLRWKTPAEFAAQELGKKDCGKADIESPKSPSPRGEGHEKERPKNQETLIKVGT